MRGRPSLTARFVDVQRARRRGFMGARTAFFDDATRAALDAGIRQVVIIGAGYDDRAVRLARAGVRFFELDHPTTQADKRRRVPDSPATFVTADLAVDDAGVVLRGAGVDADTPSLFLCEGLLPYLVPDRGAHLLRSVRAIAPPGSRLACNFHVRPTGVPFTARLRRLGVDGLLRVIGEPRLTEFHPGDAESLLTATGWHVTERREAERERDAAYALFVVAE